MRRQLADSAARTVHDGAREGFAFSLAMSNMPVITSIYIGRWRVVEVARSHLARFVRYFPISCATN
ncbi:hypothetical protein AJ87_27025 [Rhizobium yanglingense]|nr:hypothetical protein AJ87_27025 [Rhizobium yanglingense]